MDGKSRAGAVAKLLAGEYPDAATELDYKSPWELLVATVLSAQCTDVRVNQVTPVLFRRFPGPDEMEQVNFCKLMLLYIFAFLTLKFY